MEETYKHAPHSANYLSCAACPVVRAGSDDGEYRWAIDSATPWLGSDGELLEFIGSVIDIDERKMLEDQLRKLAADLSEAGRRKDEFLATLAHELRNPLAPIRSGLEVMKSVRDPETLEDVRSTLERQTQQLVTLVDDLLDVSRITQGKFELRRYRVPLSDVVRSALEASRPFIDEAGHDLAVSLPSQSVYLDADPHRLAQVVSNFLNNAAKYTPEGGRISLSAEQEGDEVVVSVADNGIGIPREMLDRIFEMFTQIDRPVEMTYTGLGIGLTFVKSLVEMHGGRVTVHSEGVNQGSRFTVRLPLAAAEESQQPTAPPGEGTVGQAGRRVLIVDDNKPAAEMLGMVVKMLGNTGPEPGSSANPAGRTRSISVRVSRRAWCWTCRPASTSSSG